MKTDIWSRLALAARWTKDHAPTFTVSFVTFSALWFAVALACTTLYIWDMNFYRSLAPPGLELTFQAAGVVFRTFVIFGGLAIVWLKTNKLNKESGFTLRFIWVMGLIACGIAALGFVTEGNDFHYRKSVAVTQTETASTESADARLARIDTEKATIRADRDKLVAGARASMNLVLDDGNSKNDDVSGYEANIRQYETDAKAKLDKLDGQIDQIEAERLSAKQTATQQSIGDPGLPAVFRAPARYIKGWDGVAFRDVFAMFWVILLEACGSVGAQSLLAVQMALSKRKAAQANGSLGGKTTARRSRVRSKLKAIEDLRAEKAQRQDVFEEEPPEDETGEEIETPDDIENATDSDGTLDEDYPDEDQQDDDDRPLRAAE
jgi:hypothetical protein